MCLPVQSMFRVACPEFPVPALNRPQNYSAEFHNFLSLCLVRDPAKRSVAADLIQVGAMCLLILLCACLTHQSHSIRS